LELFERKHFDNIITTVNLIDLLGSFGHPWSLEFSKIVLRQLYQKYADRGIYHYEMNQFLQISEFLHPGILNFKNEFLPTVDERRETWRTMIEDLFRIIELKTKIQASFEP
jgi:hypothetical protein